MVAIKGQKIVSVRWLTKMEAEREGWDTDNRPIIALVLEDGTILYPSRDEEGNGPGEIFGYNPKTEEAFRLTTK